MIQNSFTEAFLVLWRNHSSFLVLKGGNLCPPAGKIYSINKFLSIGLLSMTTARTNTKLPWLETSRKLQCKISGQIIELMN